MRHSLHSRTPSPDLNEILENAHVSVIYAQELAVDLGVSQVFGGDELVGYLGVADELLARARAASKFPGGP